MSLSKKIALYFVLLGGCIGLGCYAAITSTIYPAFEEFEAEAALEAIRRIERELDAEQRNFDTLVVEYAHWNATYNFLQGAAPGYVEENLSSSYWNSIGVDVIMLFDRDGELYWSADTTAPEQRQIHPDDILVDSGTWSTAMLTPPQGSDRLGGLLRTRKGPMRFSASPVLTTYAEGPSMGTFVIARFLDAEFDALASKSNFAGSRFLPVADAAVAGLSPAQIRTMMTVGETRLVDNRPDKIFARLLLPDPLGAPVGIVEIELDHLITDIGANTIRAAMLLIAAITAIFFLLALIMMRRQIVDPVNRLAGSMQKIRATGDLDVSIEMSRDDEIGKLATEFDQLTTKLHLARLELEATRDVAIEASRTKSEFLARMSHEIRTPMNGVLGMTELLRNTSLDFEQRRFADTIYSSAESLLDIINDVLDFSKIEAGKMELELRDFNLGALVEETVSSLAPQAHKKGLELINDVEPSLHRALLVDPVRLRQVLTNLIGNAIKFTNRGEVLVRAASVTPGADSVTVGFEVIDTGVGIQPEKQRLIFESFSQEDGSTTRLYGGTGLGLAISRQLVELMGGDLEVTSTPGGGSRFSFELTLANGKDMSPRREATPASVAGKRILIVDDNATNREIIETQLTGWRAQCESAESATEALVMLERAESAGAQYDLAILDMHMPRVDGLQLARNIREVPAYNSVSLMLLSSVAMPASESVLDELRIAGQLTKPIRQAQLYDSLAVILSGEVLFTQTGSYVKSSVRTLGGRVLLAEDNAVNQAVAVSMLDSLGIDVAVVPDGQAAIKAVQAQPFDLVLMDCQMPVMDGLEATRQIRAAEQANESRRLPIVALTANAMAGDRERCLEAGMDDYLGKPFTMDQLHAVLSMFLLPGSERASAASECGDDDIDPALFDTQSLTEPPLDRSALDVLEKLQQPGAPSLVGKVISIYLDGAGDSRDQLLASIASGDAVQVREVAHAFKSSSMNVGATRLADICKQLEILGRDGNLDGAPALGKKLEKEFERVVEALQGELEIAAK